MKRIIRNKTRKFFEYVSSYDELYQFVRYLKENHCLKIFNILLSLNMFNEINSIEELFKLKNINAIKSIDDYLKILNLKPFNWIDFMMSCNNNMLSNIWLINQLNEITYKRQNNILYKIITKWKNLIKI